MKYIYNFKTFESMSGQGQEINQEAFGRIRKAIAIIINNYGFFADLLFKLKIKESTRKSKMATDGVSIVYNPDFTNKLSIKEIVFVLCHEIMHNALFHFSRKGDRDHELYNVAADYAINILLNPSTGEGIGTMPKALYDTKYEGWSTEDIYEHLEKQPENQLKKLIQQMMDSLGKDIKDPGSLKGGKTVFGGEGEGEEGQGEGEGEGGEETDFEKASKSSGKLEREWEDSVREAFGKNRGTLPGGLERFFKKLAKSKVNWKAELKKFVANVYDNLEYKMGNRRFVHSGTYIPGITNEESDYSDIVVAIDTSGSIDEDTLSKFASELNAIVKERGIQRTHVIWCDSDIPEGGIQTFKKGELKLEKLKPVGGGGTSFVPPFTWVKKNLERKGTEVSFMIYFTDAAGDAPTKTQVGDLADRVMWVITEAESAPHIKFGKKIFI